MPDNNNKIGKIIKDVRTERKLSLQGVAAKLEIPEDELEKIEAQEIYPSLGLIIRLAGVFGVSVGELFGGMADSQFCIDRKEAGTSVSRFATADGRSPGYRYKALGLKQEDRQMEPFLVTLLPDEVHEVKANEHTGEEFIYVLDGKVKVTLYGHTDTLSPGDSIYFNSMSPHIVACDGDEPAEILAVIHVKNEMLIF